MSHLKINLPYEEVMQLSFRFETQAQTSSINLNAKNGKDKSGKILSFPKERCSGVPRLQEEQLLQRILNRSRFF